MTLLEAQIEFTKKHWESNTNINGIAIGDTELTVYVSNDDAVKDIPTEFEGYPVKVIVTNPFTAGG